MNSENQIRCASYAGVALAALLAGMAAPAFAQTGGATPTQPGTPGESAGTQSADPAATQGDDEGVGEILIVAQRREENLQDVPIAVSAATEERLENAGVESTRDIPALVPSLQFTRSGASGLLFVRGVGTTNAAVGEESSNAVYIDNVYMADLSQVINNFNNIARIEVLRGPQGTLFGRNATGGLVHIITKEPGRETQLNGEVGYGNYDTFNAKLYLGGPITDKISADIAFTGLTQRKGWGEFVAAGGREAHTQDYWGLRSKIVFRASDRLKITLAGDYNENDDNLGLAWKIAEDTIGAGGNLSPDDWDTTSNRFSITRQKFYGGSLTAQYDLGPATLTSVTAWRKTRNHSSFDVDGGPINLVNIEFVSGSKTLQQEIRLASNDSDPLAWQVGYFFLKPEVFNDSNLFGLGFAQAGLSGQHVVAKLKTISHSVFGEVTYKITPSTQITGGVRFTEDTRSFDGQQANVLLNGTELGFASNPTTRQSYDAVTWRLSVKQDINDDMNVYLSANKGFKSGSFNLQSPLSAPFAPQTIMAYEAGLKTELFRRKLRLNLAAYHYKIDDYQVRSAAVASPGSNLILNAATVKVNGIDLEFDAAPTRNWRIFGGATWLMKAEFTSFGGPGATQQAPIIYPVVVPGQTLANSCAAPALGLRDPYTGPTGPWIGGWLTCLGNVSGNRMMNAPKWTVSLGTNYTIPVGSRGGEVRLSALYNFNSGYFFEPDNVVEEDGYHLVNASIEYRPTERYGIELWMRNVFNTQYAVQKLSTATGTTEALGAPRTFGASLKFDF